MMVWWLDGSGRILGVLDLKEAVDVDVLHLDIRSSLVRLLGDQPCEYAAKRAAKMSRLSLNCLAPEFFA